MPDSEEEEAQDRPRPRVVDKRVSSGGHNPPKPAAPRPAEPPPSVQAPPPAPSTPAEPAAAPPPSSAAAVSPPTPEEPIWTPEQEAEAMRVAEEIAERPSLDWVVNTAVTLANVAATKLQVGEPADAQLAIDSLAGILNATAGRLSDAEAPLKQTLAQLQVAYAERMAPGPPPAPQ